MMDRAKTSRTVITSLSSSSSSTFSNSSSLSNSSNSITLPARHKKMEGKEKCSEEGLDAKEEELPDDDRSLSRKSSQSSFIESRKRSVTNMRGAHCLFLAKIKKAVEEDFRYHFGSNFSVSTNQI